MNATLPQLSQPFLQYTGNETDIIFNKGIDLPGFAAYPLLESPSGAELLAAYYDGLVATAREVGAGVILDTLTWTANADRSAGIGYGGARLDAVNRSCVAFAAEAQARAGAVPTVVSGMVGPRADGYAPERLMSAEQAEAYHGRQIRTLAEAGAEMINAFTIGYAEEAIGIVRVARAVGLPVAISFTVETDGRLPTGGTLREAVETVDRASDGAPAYYLVNCAHPEHAEGAWRDEAWMARVKGFVANASRCSHAELDNATELDDGDPEELGGQLAALARRFAHFTVFGGCCGTDLRHIAAIARQLPIAA
ncbi:homocysteine S-methyltransferase family protein [Acuticoccus sp. I52.16.1]|uniref:homocysteine S-methyltransferase family protein n=1 Tax=Acuticoccus sp. I52.16.1 TaxID=2928472 RepID=UPI001FCFC8C8|nr:homocysteine S-methyltransferase family protein [Acuticoccus sp. I52.16.1]UOM33341.1 homocysteine S-methyltransferase family protein [Acuticoccus sp. I52.16.1]